MKRRGVYEAGLPASSWRIATSTLIPLAFQLRCCNLGEDSYRTQGIRADPNSSTPSSTSRQDAGGPQPIPEPPADEAGSNCNRPRPSSGKLRALLLLSLLEFFKIFRFTLAAWTRTQHCTI